MEELNDFALSNAALVLNLIIMDFRGEITEISKAVKALTISATNELTRILIRRGQSLSIYDYGE